MEEDLLFALDEPFVPASPISAFPRDEHGDVFPTKKTRLRKNHHLSLSISLLRTANENTTNKYFGFATRARKVLRSS